MSLVRGLISARIMGTVYLSPIRIPGWTSICTGYLLHARRLMTRPVFRLIPPDRRIRAWNSLLAGIRGTVYL